MLPTELSHVLTPADLLIIQEAREWTNSSFKAECVLAERLALPTVWVPPHPGVPENLVDGVDTTWGLVELKTTCSPTISLSNREWLQDTRKWVQTLVVYRWVDRTSNSEPLGLGDTLNLKLSLIMRYADLFNDISVLHDSKYSKGTYAWLETLERFNLMEDAHEFT